METKEHNSPSMSVTTARTFEIHRLRELNAELLSCLRELADGHSMAAEARAREVIKRATGGGA